MKKPSVMDGWFASSFFCSVRYAIPSSLSPSVGKHADGTDAEEDQGGGFGDGS